MLPNYPLSIKNINYINPNNYGVFAKKMEK